MSEAQRPNRPEIDSRVHELLDGGGSPAGAAELERAVRNDPAAARQLAVLRALETWCVETRPRPPIRLASSVAAAAGSPRREFYRPVLAGVGLAAAALLALLVLPQTFRSPKAPETVAVSGPGSEDSRQATGATDLTVRYVFQYRTSDAEKVCLAGDFNNWKVCDAELRRVGEDLWTISLELPPGRHEYMFVVDGQWRTDPGASMTKDDGFGNRNAVLTL